MKFHSLAPWYVCAATLVPATVFGGPPDSQRMQPLDIQRVKPIKFKTDTAKVQGTSGCDGIAPICAFYSAEVFDDLNDVRNGRIWVTYFNFADQAGQSLSCAGAQYGNMLVYDEKTLKFTLNVTVDTFKDPECARSTDGVVVINFSGGPNGTYRDTSTGRGTITTDTSKTKYKVEHDVFTGEATGTNGYFQGAYSAHFEATRRTERTKAD